LLRDWVIAARTKRIAPQNSSECKPTAAHRAMPFERFDRVCGAAWIIAARGGEKRRERYLIPANEQYEECSHSRRLRACFAGSDAVPDRIDVRLKRIHVRSVRLTPSSDCDIDCVHVVEGRKQTQSHQLAKPSLETIPIDGGVLMTRYDDSNSRKRERGSEDSHVEMRSPNSLPLANYGLDVATPRQSVATRKSKAVRRLRTCSGV